jgi:hypothetical protein
MKRFIQIGILITISILGFLLIWGMIEPYVIDETHHIASIPHLPEAWSGRTIAVISDFQVGMWLDNRSTINRIINRIVDQRPAAVLILGDFIYQGGDNAPTRIKSAVELVQPLTEADLDVIAVLGNHDYSVVDYTSPMIDHERARRLTQALQETGVRVLENETVILESSMGTTLHIVGIGSLMSQRSKPNLALKDVPAEAPRIVMMHNPTSFGDVPAGTAPLAVAGHTHGGQARLPFSPQWSWVTFLREDEVHIDGWIADYGAAGNRLYVNRGIGFSKVPLRINCPPELTWFTLKSSTPQR